MIGIAAGQDAGHTWIQTEKLTADPLPQPRVDEPAERPIVTIGHDDWFGQALDLDGDRLAVGAPRADNRPTGEPGEVYVFERDGLDWSQVARLTAGSPGDNFGWGLSLTGDTLIVGAPAWEQDAGAAHIFEQSGHTWTLRTTLEIEGEGCFGASVAFEPGTLVVGSPCLGDGAAHVFTDTSGEWIQEATLTSPDPAWRFGSALLIQEDRIVVGGFGGSAQVFARSPTGSWTHTATVPTPSSNALAAQAGTLAIGSEPTDEVYIATLGPGGSPQGPLMTLTPPPDAFRDRSKFGAGVALSADGSVLAVGAAREDPSPPGSPAIPDLPVAGSELGNRGQQPGAIHVYTATADDWTHTAQLVASDSRSEWWNGEAFGASVAVASAGDVILGGAPRDACCDDPLNLGFLPSLVDDPCGFSTSTCVHEAHEADAVYAFADLSELAPGGIPP